ncbi:hypothetical protein TNCV_1592511 [Trichonephila clavipes]|nr:hypothetical protein TNCV_1592511 [Trichonephila clavipes]
MTPPKRGKFPKNIPYHDVFMGTLPSSRRGKCVTLFGGSRKERSLASKLGEVLRVIELANVMQDSKHYSDDVAKRLLKIILNIRLEEQKKREREQEK